ncbi:PTS glucose transporter subunit IIA [Alkaliphilus transvaalensis]|nr:PTS glucose transporter subunit IIA [Alkaliphilus sp. AH-315-G20]MBN4067602.1 PTS glucose transporter subunit IIA [Alkaliphilus transvaalensis]
MSGEIINIKNVPDKVFSKKMIGDGIAIKPNNGIVVSPCDGKIVTLFPTNHAIGIETEEGLQILIHLGIDTVELKGEGFKSYVHKGDYVKAGDKILEVDLDYCEKKGKSTISPIIITNMEIVEGIEKSNGLVNATNDLAMKISFRCK